MRFAGRFAIVAALCASAGLEAMLRPARAAELVLRRVDGRNLPSLALERLEADSEEFYVSANGLAVALEIERFWRPETRKLVFRVGDRRIQVTVDTRLVIDGSDDVLLHVPVRYLQGSIWVPLEFLDRVLVPALGEGARFDRRTLELALGFDASDVLGIDYGSQAEPQIRIRLARPLQYRAQVTSREIVRVQLFDARIDAVALAADRPAAFVRSVRAEQRRKEAAVYFEVDAATSGFRDETTDGGRTVLLTLLRADTTPDVLVPSRDVALPELTPVADSLDILVLDAGHGGYDTGVRGRNLNEKDVTLRICRELRPRLERALGMRVVLVRNDDQSLTAERRAEIANRARGDLLVSVHCNGWYDENASGFEILYPPSAVDAAEQELAPGHYRTADFRPWNTAQRDFAGRSQVFAEALQVELGRRLAVENRGARQAQVDVLRGVAMPAVLLEIGFLSNPIEAAMLNSDELVESLAESLAAAVRRYGDETRKRIDSGGRP